MSHYDDFFAKSRYEAIDAEYTDENNQKKKESVIRKLREILSNIESDLEELGRDKTAESLSDSLRKQLQIVSSSMYFNYLPADIRVEQAGDGSFVVGQEYIDRMDEMIRQEKESKKEGIAKKRAEIEELLRGIAASRNDTTNY